MANAPKPARRRALGLAAAVVAAPLATLAFTGSAQAAEITPIAQYVDKTVADTETEVGSVVDDLGLKGK
ncbi:hypothetical protein [Pseudonocardia phyllosphaerae]|uniref:hypothetical protein n=1 Tax=Pseudonocardia phyllosphaerae TaxID=3390502 RepID=UPI00397DBADD